MQFGCPFGVKYVNFADVHFFSYTGVMIYCRIPEYDVTIAKTETQGLACYLCSFGDMLDATYYAPSTEEMLGHLQAHSRVGSFMPPGLAGRLIADDAVNYLQPKS